MCRSGSVRSSPLVNAPQDDVGVGDESAERLLRACIERDRRDVGMARGEPFGCGKVVARCASVKLSLVFDASERETHRQSRRHQLLRPAFAQRDRRRA